MKSKSTLPITLLAALLGAAAPGARAQTQAPGLWESSFTTKSAGGQMELAQAELQRQLAAMPPEQRRNIEAMMASRGVTLSPQGANARFCLTKEQAAQPPEPRLSGDCTSAGIKRSGSTMSYRFACTTPQPVSGEGQVDFVSDKAYTGQATVTTEVLGLPQQVTMALSGRWLGADCGNVKPLGTPPAK